MSGESSILLDPKYDSVFKHIFGNDDHTSITRKFIQDVTGLEIYEIRFVDPYLKQDFSSESKHIVDILCKLENGEKILIEIQRASQSSFCDRILYYSSKVFCNSLAPGDKYFSSLRKVIVIVISVHSLPLSTTNSVSCHKIVDVESGKCDITGMSFYFLDLSKFPVERNSMNSIRSSVDVWLYFLKYAHDLDPNQLHRFEKEHPHIVEAIEALKKFCLSKDEYEKYTVYQMSLAESHLIDMENKMIEALKKGKVEIAKKMLAEGISKDVIHKITGLEGKDYVE